MAISLVCMQDIPAVQGKHVSLAHNHSSLNQICTRRVCVKRTSAGLSVAFSRMLRAPRRKVAKCSKCDLARAQRFFARNLGAPLIDEQTEAVSTTGQESVLATQRALQVSHALAHASSLCWRSNGKRRGVDSWPEFYLFIFIFEGGEGGTWLKCETETPHDTVQRRQLISTKYAAYGYSPHVMSAGAGRASASGTALLCLRASRTTACGASAADAMRARLAFGGSDAATLLGPSGVRFSVLQSASHLRMQALALTSQRFCSGGSACRCGVRHAHGNEKACALAWSCLERAATRGRRPALSSRCHASV